MYDVAVSEDAPFYYVYGGTQDNNSFGCPAKNKFTNLTNADCFVTMGGDGFYSRVDPKDPNTIYANMQNGGMVRFDKRTGERVSIQPQPEKGDPALRWNWDAPLIVSPHSNTRLYFGAQKLYRCDDRGDSWNGELRRPDPRARPQQAPTHGQDLAHRRHPEKRLHRALRQHLVDGRIARSRKG